MVGKVIGCDSEKEIEKWKKNNLKIASTKSLQQVSIWSEVCWQEKEEKERANECSMQMKTGLIKKKGMGRKVR